MKFAPRGYYIPDPGTIIVCQDADQQEYRLLAHYGNDENFQDMVRRGYDIHSGTASMLYGVPYEEVTDDLRSKGKTGNFATVYGIGNPHLANSMGYHINEPLLKQGTKVLYQKYRPWKLPPYSMDVTEQMVISGIIEEAVLAGIHHFFEGHVQEGLKFAADFKKKYFAQFPGIKQFIKDASKAAEDRGYIKYWTGRRRHFHNPKEEAYKAPNALIQGGCGEIMKKKMWEIREFLRNGNYRTQLINSVHDEVSTQHPYDEIWLVPKLNEILRDLPFSVPITWGIDWSPTSWADKRPWVSVEQALKDLHIAA